MPFHREPRGRRPQRIIARTVGLAGTSLLAAALLAWSPSVATGWNQSSAEATLWQLMNGARVNNGRGPLQQNGTLVSLARWRSKDQVQRSYFDHTVLGTGYQVFHWYDLNGLRYRYGGENIGWNSGYSDSESAVKIHEGFMNSAGHRANILNPDWTHGGVGAYAADNVSFLGKTRSPRFFTELFMQAVSSSSAPPPPPPSGSKPAPPPPPRSGGGVSTHSPSTHSPSSAAAPRNAKPKREASEVSIATPNRPQPGTALDGTTAVLVSSERTIAPSKLALLAFVDNWQNGSGPAPQVLAATGQTAGPYRVERNAAPAGGFFETVLGSLLGGVLG